ncbi:15062_t:CDS:1, partial [Funneliformis geosporum]
MTNDLYSVDFLSLDVRSKDLHEKISKRLKVEYLTDSYHQELKVVSGIIFGPDLKIIVSLPVKIKQKTKNVHFVVDTGSPKTFVCEEVYESFKVTIPDSTVHHILLNNKPTVVYLPPINSNFMDINVLGTEYLKAVGANLTVNFDNEYVSISFEYDEIRILPQLGQMVESNISVGIIGVGLLT